MKKLTRLTPKQEKLVKGISENLRIKNKTKSMGKLAREAGYSEQMSQSPSEILKSPAIQDALQDLLKGISRARANALKQINPEKLKKTNAKDSTYIVDVLTKNHRLLDNKTTESREIRIDISEDIAGKNI